MAASEARPDQPSLPWRMASAAIMSLTGAISRAFLHGLNDVQTEGLPQFLEVLDKRRAEVPQRGLITGTATSSHFFMYPSTNETMADCFSYRLQSQTTLACEFLTLHHACLVVDASS